MSTTEFVTKDSGQRVEWATGSRRDVEDGKLDYSLLPYKSLRRLIGLYMRGAEKYGRYNWQKGQDMGRVDRSLGRHFAQYMIGERDEDHLAAIAWNAICLMDHEDRIESGELPSSIDTRDEQRQIQKGNTPSSDAIKTAELQAYEQFKQRFKQRHRVD